MVWGLARIALLASLCVACRDQSAAPQGSTAEIAKQALAPRHEVDVPILATTQGTIEAPEGQALVLTGAAGEVEAQRATLPELGPVLLAVGPDVKFAAAARSLDDLYRLGRGDLELLVRAGNTRRMVVIEKLRARASSDAIETSAEIALGATIRLNDQPVTLDALSTAISRIKPTIVAIVPEPTVTMQRLVEVMAAAGGRAHVGAGILPHVEHP